MRLQRRMRRNSFRLPTFLGLRRGLWEGLDNLTFNSLLLELVLDIPESEEEEEEEE